MRDLLLVALGGALGSVSRYGLARWQTLPYGTLAANVIACLVLGYLSGRLGAQAAGPNHPWRLLIGAGFCGGLSTFSTLILELVGYGERATLPTAFGYLAASLALGTLALLAGLWLGRLS